LKSKRFDPCCDDPPKRVVIVNHQYRMHPASSSGRAP
jgi:hypothetical protein